jgi:hypothetical protein
VVVFAVAYLLFSIVAFCGFYELCLSAEVCPDSPWFALTPFGFVSRGNVDVGVWFLVGFLIVITGLSSPWGSLCMSFLV